MKNEKSEHFSISTEFDSIVHLISLTQSKSKSSESNDYRLLMKDKHTNHPPKRNCCKHTFKQKHTFTFHEAGKPT